MNRDLRLRLLRAARITMTTRRLQRVARRVSKHEDQVVNGILHLFMPVESLLSRPGTEDNRTIKEINSAGGVRPWVKQKMKKLRELGRPSYQSLRLVYSTLKEVVDEYPVKMVG